MHVVAWYLPTFEDVDADLQALTESAALDVGGLAVDIESTAIADVAERNRRLLDLSTRLRAAVGPDKAVAAITPSAVHLQVVNPSYWPAFPWTELADTYDALLPMTYWSIRTGDLRNGETYTADNLDRIRASVGDPDIPIVPVGGLAEDSTVDDLEGMVTPSIARRSPGGGLYDWATSTPEQWAVLAPLRDLQLPVPEPRSTIAPTARYARCRRRRPRRRRRARRSGRAPPGGWARRSGRRRRRPCSARGEPWALVCAEQGPADGRRRPSPGGRARPRSISRSAAVADGDGGARDVDADHVAGRGAAGQAEAVALADGHQLDGARPARRRVARAIDDGAGVGRQPGLEEGLGGRRWP